MRMWNVEPQCLCRVHLLGEHCEIHMFVGLMKTGTNLSGYIEGGLVEVHSLKRRHKELAKEMIKRGMNHASPLPYYVEYEAGKVDVYKSKVELAGRCQKCKALIGRFE